MIFASLNPHPATTEPDPVLVDAPSAFLARQWLRQHLADDTLQVAVYAGRAPRMVAQIRTVGNAAGSPNTLRHEVRERERGRWTGWRRI